MISARFSRAPLAPKNELRIAQYRSIAGAGQCREANARLRAKPFAIDAGRAKVQPAARFAVIARRRIIVAQRRTLRRAPKFDEHARACAASIHDRIRSMQTSRIVHVLALLVALASSLRAQPALDASGTWRGSIAIPGAALAVVVELTSAAGAFSGTIDIPAQGATGLPLTNVSASGARVTFTIGGIPGAPTFDGTIDGDRMTGTFSQGGGAFPFTLARTVPATRGAPSDAAIVDSIRAYVRGAIRRFDVPGVAVAVVRDGTVLLAEGFGLRDVEAAAPMTASTLMPIGSTTKAFTAFVIGTLVAEGKLDWDEPVERYLPEFQLADEGATRTLRVRDLLTHVSGLPRHDFVWYGSSLSRAELFARLRHLESTEPIRTTFQYQNLMYMAAGVLAERVSGSTWESLVEERIFRPLAMTSTTTSIDPMRASADHATGYAIENGKATPMPYRSAEAVGPAGSINSNVSEMARWVQLQIAGGEHQRRPLIAPEALAEIHAPQVVVPGAVSQGGGRMLFDLYAMGWREHAYRGHRLLQHDGNIDGFSAEVGFLPDERIGVVVLANANGSPLPGAALKTIVDILLDERDFDWEAAPLAALTAIEGMIAQSRAIADEALRVPGTRPSHPTAEYAGEYAHPAYGTVGIVTERDRLRIRLRGVDAPLEHFHYDVFRIADPASMFDGLLVTFGTSTTGEIDAVELPLEMSLDPIEFTRVASPALREPRVLDRYVGTYELSGQAVSVRRIDSALVVTIPGQPAYTLEPTGEAAFGLEGLSGFSIRFIPRGERAVRMIFIQPNGTFAATRTE